jgi:hypothetical protein
VLQSDWEQPPSSLFIISAINTNMGGKNTERARKALDAMKELGISRKQATPVLKELLATFDNNWEPIEDEHYRALADAIFARQDNKQTSPSQQVIILLSTSPVNSLYLPSPLTPYCCKLLIFVSGRPSSPCGLGAKWINTG